MGDFHDPIAIPMLQAVSALDSVSDAVPLGNTRQHHHGITFTGVATGHVKVETGPSPTFAGAWQEIYDADAAVQAYHEITWPGPGLFVRHRISTVLNAGSVSSNMRRLQAGA